MLIKYIIKGDNMSIRAVRGATTAMLNDRDSILNATKEMLIEILNCNSFQEEQIISVFFTATKDLTKAYPAEAARSIGILSAALACNQEMYVEGSLERCIRVLMHVETDIPQDRINHVYLNEAVSLRPDLVKKAGKK